MTKKIIIIGSGFSSISAATYLANNGYDVSLQYSIVGREDKAVGVEFFLERTR